MAGRNGACLLLRARPSVAVVGTICMRRRQGQAAGSPAPASTQGRDARPDGGGKGATREQARAPLLRRSPRRAAGRRPRRRRPHAHLRPCRGVHGEAALLPRRRQAGWWRRGGPPSAAMAGLTVRNLGNFSSNLIQEEINIFVTLDMWTCDLNVMNI